MYLCHRRQQEIDPRSPFIPASFSFLLRLLIERTVTFYTDLAAFPNRFFASSCEVVRCDVLKRHWLLTRVGWRCWLDLLFYFAHTVTFPSDRSNCPTWVRSGR